MKKMSRSLVSAVATAAIAVAVLVIGSASGANADVIAQTSTQTRCYNHHIQKRTVTTYVEDGTGALPAGTVAAATTYGPWVTKSRTC